MSRGQTLPVWLISALTTVTFGYFIASYGNMVAIQFRAQSAADTLANAAVSLQSQNFNQMTETLYASDVEEYRLRHLLEALRVSGQGSGGCTGVSTASCAATWNTLVKAYDRSVHRYDQDAQLLNSITGTMGYTHLTNDVQLLVNGFDSVCANRHSNVLAVAVQCTPSTSLFTYHLIKVAQRTQNLKNVQIDATNALLPDFSNTGASTAYPGTFAPIAVEVAVCATVPPLLRMTWPLQLPTTQIIARAAATNALIEEDWIEPGNTYNPKSSAGSGLFQPYENYAPIYDTKNGNHGWYNVNYGGNSSTVTYQSAAGVTPGTPLSNSHIKAHILTEEFSARTGWWGPVQIVPFTQMSTGSTAKACTTNG
jgi:hypothetical protein